MQCCVNLLHLVQTFWCWNVWVQSSERQHGGDVSDICVFSFSVFPDGCLSDIFIQPASREEQPGELVVFRVYYAKEKLLRAGESVSTAFQTVRFVQ